MQTIIVVLNSQKMNNPDLDIRYILPDRIEEYTDNSDNFNIFNLNTICNYDPDIISLLDNDFGNAFYKDDGVWIKEHL